ncbi:MAG: hypothetical protein U1E36_00660 [Rickettsiales bacterium]
MNVGYPSHIQDDFDYIIPFWRDVLKEVEKNSPLSPAAIMECMEEWRLTRGTAQTNTMFQLAMQGDPANREGPLLQITAATAERLKNMDLKGITTGIGSRMLMGLTEEHDKLQLSATQVRQILNRVAADTKFDIKKYTPELVPFLQGRSAEQTRLQ